LHCAVDGVEQVGADRVDFYRVPQTGGECGLHCAVDGVEQVGADRVDFYCVPQTGGECGDGRFGVAARAVEVVIDNSLDAGRR
jgi:hypothetical protein